MKPRAAGSEGARRVGTWAKSVPGRERQSLERPAAGGRGEDRGEGEGCGPRGPGSRGFSRVNWEEALGRVLGAPGSKDPATSGNRPQATRRRDGRAVGHQGRETAEARASGRDGEFCLDCNRVTEAS